MKNLKVRQDKIFGVREFCEFHHKLKQGFKRITEMITVM